MIDIKIYKNFNILCVDDDENILEIYKQLFSLIFKEVFVASNGLEGLEIFKKEKIDLIISDIAMPKMNGIEMVKEIRKIDFNIPILLVTAFENMELLKKAIDLNVTGFLKKPLNKEILFSKLELIAKSILAERYILNQQRKYIEYTTHQEKLAYEKEKLISRSYQDKIYEYKTETFYKPKDILAGDSYVINKNIIFLVDAMGKGVSASITAMLSSAFVNFLISKDYEFETIIKKYIEFIKNYLLEEEIVSASFYKFDKEKVCYSSFSMPAALIQKNKEIKKIKSNNPPITNRTKDIKINSISKDFEKFMTYTDGITEAEVGEKLYFSFIKDDFKKSNNLNEFISFFFNKSSIIDDITIIFLRRD